MGDSRYSEQSPPTPSYLLRSPVINRERATPPVGASGSDDDYGDDDDDDDDDDDGELTLVLGPHRNFPSVSEKRLSAASDGLRRTPSDSGAARPASVILRPRPVEIDFGTDARPETKPQSNATADSEPFLGPSGPSDQQRQAPPADPSAPQDKRPGRRPAAPNRYRSRSVTVGILQRNGAHLNHD